MSGNSAMEPSQPTDVQISLDDPPPPSYAASVPNAEASPAHSENIAPPPSYEDAATDDPPSYNSIFGQMQEARMESSSVLDYIKKIVKLVLSTFCVTVFMMVVLVVPLSMIVIGFMFFNDCPVERKIPIFLVVMGAVYILKNLADLRKRWLVRDDVQQEVRAPKEYEDFFSRLLGCALIAFFITGNVWTYSIYPFVNTKEETSEYYCHPVCYFYTFWLMTVIYIICGLTCCGICCTAGMAASTNSSARQ